MFCLNFPLNSPVLFRLMVIVIVVTILRIFDQILMVSDFSDKKVFGRVRIGRMLRLFVSLCGPT